MRATGDGAGDPLTPYRTIDRRGPGGRAWVMANMVAGLDGTAAIGGRVSSLSSPCDARLFTRLRGLADVVLVGARTVRRERYGPIVLDDDLAECRRAAGRRPPRLAIVSSSLDLDLDLPVFGRAAPDASPIVVTSARSDLARLSSAPVEVVVAGDERVSIPAAIAALTDLEHEVVLCEGGPMLLGEIIAADLLDEYCLTIAPVVGGDPLPVVDTSTMSGLARFALHHVATEEDTVFLDHLRERRS